MREQARERQRTKEGRGCDEREREGGDKGGVSGSACSRSLSIEFPPPLFSSRFLPSPALPQYSLLSTQLLSVSELL